MPPDPRCNAVTRLAAYGGGVAPPFKQFWLRACFDPDNKAYRPQQFDFRKSEWGKTSGKEGVSGLVTNTGLIILNSIVFLNEFVKEKEHRRFCLSEFK